MRWLRLLEVVAVFVLSAMICGSSAGAQAAPVPADPLSWIITSVKDVGFPIAAFGALYYVVLKKLDSSKDAVAAISANTAAMTEVATAMREVKEVIVACHSHNSGSGRKT